MADCNNCKYRQFLVNAYDIHIDYRDCDMVNTNFCQKMQQPDTTVIIDAGCTDKTIYHKGYMDGQKSVAAVQGRWVHPKGYVVSNGFLCSECGHEEASHHPINPRSGGCCIADENGNFFYPPKINYCPNCGADMRERKDNG